MPEDRCDYGVVSSSFRRALIVNQIVLNALTHSGLVMISFRDEQVWMIRVDLSKWGIVPGQRVMNSYVLDRGAQLAAAGPNGYQASDSIMLKRPYGPNRSP